MFRLWLEFNPLYPTLDLIHTFLAILSLIVQDGVSSSE